MDRSLVGTRGVDGFESFPSILCGVGGLGLMGDGSGQVVEVPL